MKALIPLTVPRGAPAAVLVDLATHSLEQIGAGVVSVEASPSGQGSTQPLQKLPATPQSICAAVVLN